MDAVAAQSRFSGVVRVDSAGSTELCTAYGLADRAHEVPNTVATVFGLASGAKGLTALAVMGLVERGTLELGTTARSLLGDDLPLVADDVTIEHLLAHRSGIGDYIDEDHTREYVLPVPVHELATTQDYLLVLAERATGVPYYDLVRTLVCEPAGMTDTAFLRSDELPGRAALGYLSADGLRTNVLHLPVRGSGDGGVYSTAADFSAFWEALFAGRIVSLERLAEMVRPRSDWPEESRRFGFGFHLRASGDGVFLEGHDAGVSFASLHLPGWATTCTVISNWSEGAWPVMRVLSDRFDGWGSRPHMLSPGS